MYCFRVDKNGWLEHLYWGPWLDSKDDMTYLQYANVSLPFDPKVSNKRLCVCVCVWVKVSDMYSFIYIFFIFFLVWNEQPARITAGQVISQLANQDESSLRGIWARAQLYNQGTDDPNSITAARIENAAWRLMQMQAHCPAQAEKTKNRVSELLRTSSLPGIGSTQDKNTKENPVLTVSALRTFTPDDDTAPSPNSLHNSSFQNSGMAPSSITSEVDPQTEPQKADYAKIAEAMASLAHGPGAYTSNKEGGSASAKSDDDEELPSAHPFPSVAPQVRDLRDEMEGRVGVPSVVESIFNPNVNQSNFDDACGWYETNQGEEQRQGDNTKAVSGSYTALSSIHRAAMESTHDERNSIEREKSGLTHNLREQFNPVAGAQAVSKAHGPSRLRRSHSEAALDSIRSSGESDGGQKFPRVSQAASRKQAVSAAAGAGRLQSLKDNKLPSEEVKPSICYPSSKEDNDQVAAMDDILVDTEHEMEAQHDDDDDVVGRNMKLLEYSDSGTGDYRSPSFVVEYEDGSTISPLEYKDHFIHSGKNSNVSGT